MDDNKPQVLIVEDEKPLAHSLEFKLQREDMITSVAIDGEQCIAMLRQRKFNIVLLDILMPVVDGYAVLKFIQSMPDKPVVLVLTNLSQPQNLEQLLAMGAKKVFIKSDTPMATVVSEVKAAIQPH